MAKDILDTASKFFARLDKDVLTTTDFKNAFEKVINLVLKIQQEQKEAIQQLGITFEALLKRVQDEQTISIENIKTKSDQLVIDSTLMQEFETLKGTINALTTTKLEEIDIKVANIKPIKGDKGDKGDVGEQLTSDEVTMAISPILEEARKRHEDMVQEVLTKRGGVRGLGGSSVIVPRIMKGITSNSTPSFTGAINGSNAAYVLPKTPVGNARDSRSGVATFLNGVRQDEGSSNDFTVSGKTVTFASAPLTGDKILFDIDY